MIFTSIILFFVSIFFIIVVVQKLKGQQRHKMNDYLQAGIFIMLYALVALQTIDNFIELFIKIIK